jgi:hypothetical protein
MPLVHDESRMRVSTSSIPTHSTYEFRDLCRDILSPGAVGVMEQLEHHILEIYELTELLDARLPGNDRSRHSELIITRLGRLSKMLPPDISRMPNEIFTAIEFIVYEILERPVDIGEAWIRLELLADEFRARPLVHDLIIGLAN